MVSWPKVLVYDRKLMRPACPMLQALFGGTVGASRDFPAETWLLSETEDMSRYIVSSQEEMEKLVGISRKGE